MRRRAGPRIHARKRWRRGGDPYDARTAATMHACETAALIAMFEVEQRELEAELAAIWRWFERGHWPCAIEASGRLVVL